MLLQEQNGHIDGGFLRRLLAEAPAPALTRRAAHGFLSQLRPEPSSLPFAWCALPTATNPLYFPVFLAGDLPAALAEEEVAHEGRLWRHLQRLRQCLSSDPEVLARASEEIGRLQARLDQETEEFISELTGLKARDRIMDLHRQASLFMEHHLESVEEVLAELLHELALVPSTY